MASVPEEKKKYISYTLGFPTFSVLPLVKLKQIRAEIMGAHPEVVGHLLASWVPLVSRGLNSVARNEYNLKVIMNIYPSR